MSENLDKLITEISLQANEVKVKYSPERTFLKWLLLTVLYLFLASLIFGIKHDLLARILQDSFYAIEVFSLALVVLTSLFACCYLGIPDVSRKRYILILPLLAIGVFIVDLCTFCIFNQSPEPVSHMRGMICVSCIILSALVPAILLFCEIKKAAPTKLKLTVFYIFIYATSLAALVLRLEEADHPIYENIIYHYLPILVISALGIFTTEKFLKW